MPTDPSSTNILRDLLPESSPTEFLKRMAAEASDAICRRRAGEAVGEILAITKAVAVVVEMDDAKARVTYVMHWPNGERDSVRATYEALGRAISVGAMIRTVVLAATPGEMRRGQ